MEGGIEGSLVVNFTHMLMIILSHTHIKGEASHKVGQYYALGLQDFTPAEGYYDLIWCQWVLSHLTDGTVIAVCA